MRLFPVEASGVLHAYSRPTQSIALKRVLLKVYEDTYLPDGSNSYRDPVSDEANHHSHSRLSHCLSEKMPPVAVRLATVARRSM
jgi:hypothetical protein